ncbi:hypothetical protein FKM82_009193 [Ascaphus truei]
MSIKLLLLVHHGSSCWFRESYIVDKVEKRYTSKFNLKVVRCSSLLEGRSANVEMILVPTLCSPPLNDRCTLFPRSIGYPHPLFPV